MTRPKVPPDQRQRTAQACESCKRRKQKCNGLCPCNTCQKRKFTCIYTDRDPISPNDGRLPAKRRAVEEGDSDSIAANDDLAVETQSNGRNHDSPKSPHKRGASTTQKAAPAIQDININRPDLEQEPSFKSPIGAPRQSIEVPNNTASTGYLNGDHPTLTSRGTTVHSGPEEEAVIYSQSRMLQDPTGRVLYIGDSATLSFLQLLRMMVETVAGSSPFTNDPRRHKIVEGQYSLPFGYCSTHLLPDLQTARVLAEAFFINTHGLLQVFDQNRFMGDIERCYSDPLSVEPSWLCLLNLVFAIGLTMATPLSGSPEALVIDKLKSEHLDRAEAFYLNAKRVNDPMSGFEDQDSWAIQALLLMSVYMLAKSKRNTAFALLGMAARSAQALGLHREETMVIFSLEEQTSRKNLWRSIFVLDRLISCSLGRPTAISEDDCSGDTLNPSAADMDQSFMDLNGMNDYGERGSQALEAAVRSCSVIGVILRKVYQRRKISTRLAQEIADVCKAWPRALPSMLHWRRAASATPGQGVAILHVNLLYCHSIILLTRPFFLYILNFETQRQVGQTATRGPRPYLRMEKFSEACVIASTHTILLAQNAFDAGYLSRRNPAVIYFLFAGALVILANEFAGLYRVDASDTCIINAINIMNYCAESDQQASRLVYILSAFRDIVAQQRMRRKQAQSDISSLPSISAQLYGPSSGEESQPPSSTSNSLAQATNPLIPMTRLHQVPIHIYPGMETAPIPSPPSFSQQRPDLSHHHSSQAPHDFAVHLSPIQDPPATTSEIDLFINGTEPLNIPSKPPSLSMMLDLSALEDTRAPSLHSEESAADEQIDFDALWAWPSNTPATGTPRFEGPAGVVDRMQSISDSAVPLFGITGAGQE